MPHARFVRYALIGVLLASTAHAHVWRAYCNGRRQGYAADTSAECNTAISSWNFVAVVCRDLRGEARDKELSKVLPANTDFDGTCKNMRGVTNCTCEPEAVPGEH
jgi:hypothetical protein